MNTLNDYTANTSSSTCPEPIARGSDWTQVFCTIIKTTEKAIFVGTYDNEGMPVKVWIPVSQTSEVHKDGTGNYTSYVVVKNWIAREKGLI